MTKQEFLAMSLPYELKMLQSCEHWYTPEPNRVVLLTGIADVDGKAPMEYGNEPTETTIFYRLSKDITGTDYVLRFKPILRPLSDITKPIEHKGERFVPIVKLMQIAYESQDSCITSKSVYVKDNMYTVKVNVFEFAFDIDDNSFISILNNSFSAVPKQLLLFQKLTEWHFDIADLISKGEAIDVNTLDVNPYK